ncbi:unnamed protein product [Arabidopsis thaliana]|uniref:(thale cress) hypothetical protein n=1 Tax=Arabidopsis thaliana TaxID=3702 RepID=A0A7G2FKA1_ARATH|nr:unnamed protein product [Arabidopsis thaliana]
MATETLDEKTPEVNSPAKEEIDVVPKEEKEVEKEKVDSPRIGEAEEEKKEDEEEGEAKEGELGEKDKEDDVESEEEEEEEEGSGSKKSSEKETVTPTSERPTRERKKVERFSLSTPMRAPPSKSVSIEKGRGTPLREIPNVAHKLSKRKADDNLMLLHTILFGKKAKAQMVKRNIGQFSGFAWSEKEEEKQRARIKEKIDKCVKEKLIVFCDVLDIPISRSNVKKEELAVKVLEFLESPKETRDVIIADQEKAKKRKSTPKRGKSGESSDTPAKRKRQTKKRDLPSDTEEGKDEGDADSEGTNDPHEEDDAAPEEESDHEKTDTDDEKDEVEVEKPSKKKSSSKKTVEESSGSKAKKQKVDHVESSKEKSKKQPRKATKKGKAKAEPTRKEMLEVVSKILKEVDFNTATLSDILQKLSDHFGVELSHRKPESK